MKEIQLKDSYGTQLCVFQIKAKSLENIVKIIFQEWEISMSLLTIWKEIPDIQSLKLNLEE